MAQDKSTIVGLDAVRSDAARYAKQASAGIITASEYMLRIGGLLATRPEGSTVRDVLGGIDDGLVVQLRTVKGSWSRRQYVAALYAVGAGIEYEKLAPLSVKTLYSTGKAFVDTGRMSAREAFVAVRDGTVPEDAETETSTLTGTRRITVTADTFDAYEAHRDGRDDDETVSALVLGAVDAEIADAVRSALAAGVTVKALVTRIRAAAVKAAAQAA